MYGMALSNEGKLHVIISVSWKKQHLNTPAAPHVPSNHITIASFTPRVNPDINQMPASLIYAKLD